MQIRCVFAPMACMFRTSVTSGMPLIQLPKFAVLQNMQVACMFNLNNPAGPMPDHSFARPVFVEARCLLSKGLKMDQGLIADF